jgi:uroporphyrinogen decarboxylase
MTMLSHRDRLVRALNHQPPDRVPLDLGSHPNASIHVNAYQELKSHLGIKSETKMLHRWMQVALVDEEVLRLFDIDTRRLALGKRDVPLERDLDDITYIDQWGVVRSKPPSALYFEVIKSPLAGEISISDVVQYAWPDPHDRGITRGLRKRAQALRQRTDFAVVVTVPSAFVHYTQFIRGFEDWYIDCVNDVRLIETLFDAVLEINIASVQEILREVGDLVDVVVTADDLGDQRGTIVSPDTFKKLIKPRLKRYFDEIHRLTDAKLLFHTCGSIFNILLDFIEIGVDVLNPVQVSAANMDTIRLKKVAGEKLAFWGAIDTLQVLPYGLTSDVRDEVKRRISDLGGGGGYVLSAVHNIQPGVPPENICQIFQAAQEFGEYSSQNPKVKAL